MFSFVGKIENVGFPEAVRIVAQKCGIPLPKREFSSPEEAAGARLRAKLLELHETAAAWFEEQLRGPGGARGAGVPGWAGNDSRRGSRSSESGTRRTAFNALHERLRGMADEETLRASGLFSSKEQGDGSQGPIYDRFRKRVMFPISNEGGRVIAFTARTLETGEKAGAEVHQLAGDAALFEGPGALQSGQGEAGDSAGWSLRCWWKARWIASASFWREFRT